MVIDHEAATEQQGESNPQVPQVPAAPDAPVSEPWAVQPPQAPYSVVEKCGRVIHFWNASDMREYLNGSTSQVERHPEKLFSIGKPPKPYSGDDEAPSP